MSLDVSDDAPQTEINRLRVELATIRGELSATKAALSATQATLDRMIEQNGQAIASNAALAMSLRESMQLIENPQPENVTSTAASTQVQSEGPARSDAPQPPAPEHRGRFSSLFGRF